MPSERRMEAEAELEARYGADAGAAALYSTEAICELQSALFAKLPATDRRAYEGELIEPGALRTREVRVERHVAPQAQALDAFLQRCAQVYRCVRSGEAALIAALCAHQRLGWIHPFVDGNGRVMRLHTHTLLHALGYTGSLWSPLRGFARNTERYFALLDAAFAPRAGDLDGRGNLSEAALVEWLHFALDVCMDHVQFMKQTLDLSTLRQRLDACLNFEEQARKSGVRRDALHALHYLYLSGEEMSRGDFKSLLGLRERTAGDVLAARLKRGLVVSDSPQGKVRIGFPHHALRFVFPALWPEAEADAGA